MDGAGNFVVVWQSNGQDGSGYGVYGQRYNAAGAAVGGEFAVNTTTTLNQGFPTVALDADGDVTVLWQSNMQDGSQFGVYGQRFNAAGAKVGGEFLVNAFTLNTQSLPAVRGNAAGELVAVWQSATQDGNGFGIFGQRFSSSGARVGGEFQVNTKTFGNQAAPALAVRPDGQALVVWLGPDDSGDGIFGQRLAAPPAARVAGVTVNDGSAQRSRVTSLTIAFDAPVSFVGAPESAFSLINQKTGTAATLAVALGAANTTAMLTFTGGAVDAGGSLADGRYTLTVLANQFAGGGLDGGAGVGSNFVEVGSPTSASKLFRLFGDADGDGDVDAQDFGAFRAAFGGSGFVFDADGDGDVDAQDFGQFRARFGSSV
jgi:hypothetical protein